MFRRFRFALLVTVAAALAITAATAQAPSPLAAAIAATQAAKTAYNFDYVLGTSKQNWRAQFDARSAPPRLHLVEPRRETLPSGEQHTFDALARRMEGVSWCASEGLDRVANLRLVRDDGATALYSFQPTREQAQGAAQHLRGELTLIKAGPDIAAIRFFAPQPFSPIPLTRLEALDTIVRCEVAPNGRRYAAETVITMRGSALGQNFNERSVTRTTNLRPPP